MNLQERGEADEEEVQSYLNNNSPMETAQSEL